MEESNHSPVETEDQKRLFIKEFISGKTAVQIGRENNVPSQYVLKTLQSGKIQQYLQYVQYKKLHKESIKALQFSPTTEQKQKFIKEFTSGKTASQIGRENNIPVRHVIKTLRSDNMPQYMQYKMLHKESHRFALQLTPGLKEQKQKFIKEFISGKTALQIGKENNLSAKHVIKILQSDKMQQYLQYKKLHKESVEAPKIKKFLRLCKKLGRIPSPTEILAYDSRLFSLYEKCTTIAEEQGYINNNLKYGIKREGNVEKILNHLRMLAAKLGHTPTIEDVAIDNTYGVNTYYNYFATFSKALMLAGLTTGRPRVRPRSSKDATRESCLQDIRNLSEKLGHFPNLFECRKLGKYPINNYFQLCGTLTEIKMMIEK